MSGATSGPTPLAVLVTCHNRRETTLRCLAALSAQDTSTAFEVFLVDDGSTDGTGDAVRAAAPQVHVIQGSGDLYWVGGMRLAYDRAVAAGVDDVLWLNDDVELLPTAISTLLGVLSEMDSPEEPAIVIGAVRDPTSGATTYSGLRRVSRLRRLVHQRLEPADVPIRCDTMHGNVVLVSGAARRRVGNLDGAFTHAMADTDYGLRARRRGCAIWLAPGHLGTCTLNLQRTVWEDPSIPRRARMGAVLSAKGRPPREWLRLTWRHGGPLWFVHALAPYGRAFLGRPHRRRSSVP